MRHVGHALPRPGGLPGGLGPAKQEAAPGNAKMTRCYCETPFAEFTLKRSEGLKGKLRDQ